MHSPTSAANALAGIGSSLLKSVNWGPSGSARTASAASGGLGGGGGGGTACGGGGGGSASGGGGEGGERPRVLAFSTDDAGPKEAAPPTAVVSMARPTSMALPGSSFGPSHISHAPRVSALMYVHCGQDQSVSGEPALTRPKISSICFAICPLTR